MKVIFLLLILISTFISAAYAGSEEKRQQIEEYVNKRVQSAFDERNELKKNLKERNADRRWILRKLLPPKIPDTVTKYSRDSGRTVFGRTQKQDEALRLFKMHHIWCNDQTMPRLAANWPVAYDERFSPLIWASNCLSCCVFCCRSCDSGTLASGAEAAAAAAAGIAGAF